MCLPIIHGSSMADRLRRGQVGIPIPEFGGVAPIFPSALVSALAGSEGLAGAGATGDVIGTVVTACTTAADTTREAERSITGTPTIAADMPPTGQRRLITIRVTALQTQAMRAAMSTIGPELA